MLIPVAVGAGVGGELCLRQLFREKENGKPLVNIFSRYPMAAQFAVIIVWFAPLLYWNAVNHPNQLCFYNRLTGGLSGAQKRLYPDATDYWGQSYRQGMRWLNRHAGPNAVVMAGVAEHIPAATFRLWLRPDLRFRPIAGVPAETVQGRIEAASTEVHFMFITRTSHYTPLIRWVQAEYRPEHDIRVDGGSLLQIYRLK